MRIGVDLGGTKIEAVVLNREGTVLLRERVPTPTGDYEGTVAALAGLVGDLEREVGAACTVGVGTPGSISPFTGLMRNSNSVALNGMPLDRDLEAALDRPVRLANDADCFALSEAVSGAGREARTVFGVIIGTGVGGGLVIDRAVQVGPNRITGEWGHNPFPGEFDSRKCYCGRLDCIELYLSGPAVAAEYRRETGIELTTEQLMRRVATDRPAQAALERYVARLARALAGVINILDPDVVVLGGGLSNVDRLYEAVPRLWDQWVFSDGVATRLARNHHGDSGGVLGAAWLWPARSG
ncbi:MAG: ROK family protein [bacterium]|nr:ROK family protein [bacterium]MDE0290765.1 ROK family protein [bacterium]MDE0440069.1 ROK family protein [bacterium]